MPIAVLFIEFTPDDNPGRLASGLEALGARAEVARVHRGDPLPSLDHFDALVPLGGAMNAEDDEHYPYLREVVALLQEAARRTMPVLGICLGGQLLARALGARVWRKPAKEIGYFPIQLTTAGRADPLFKGLGGELLALQWHGDAFDVPEGATLLADSTRDTAQAFRHGACYGLQFHPEVTVETVARWCGWKDDALRTAAEPTTRDALLARARAVDQAFAAQTVTLCVNWHAIVEEYAAARRR